MIHFRFIIKKALLLAILYMTNSSLAQNQIAAYAGNEGAEAFNDVAQLSNGHFIVAGTADNLTWISASVPIIAFANPGITNTAGTLKTAFILELDQTLQQILKVYQLPSGAAEDFRFIKMTNLPGIDSSSNQVRMSPNPAHSVISINAKQAIDRISNRID